MNLNGIVLCLFPYVTSNTSLYKCFRCFQVNYNLLHQYKTNSLSDNYE